jgi:tetratricopeptide (TPR) repeat protein
MAYLDAGERGKALPHFQQAAVGVEKLDFAHGHAQQIIHNLANCHESLAQYEQAEVWRRKWVAAVKARDGMESARYANLAGLEGLGWNLIRQKRYTDAEPILRESLAILQQKEPELWSTLRTQSRLGGALLGQQKFAEAEPHVVQGYRGMKGLEKEMTGAKFYGASPGQELTEALERLVQLYDAWNKPAEAAKWRKELEKMKEQP